MSFAKNTTFEISANLVYRKHTESKFVLLEIEGEQLFELEHVSAFIWDLIVKNANYEQIILSLKKEYEDFGTTEQIDVDEFLESLISKNTITPSRPSLKRNSV